ncbi:flagella synthesis protein FlgN [Massilia horti]|uniref:Flagellar protein FlgN n=1 Tax=Massilia horti TaxID=2562153 RepID=A0A4Y9T4R6_9BURK|nr:flagellar protein FlgN [Massilia horti]TFW32067.1 flagellar protein FlgN [Massilia horti]
MNLASPNVTLLTEQQLVGSLVELMQQEQDLLIKADAEGLAALMPHKSELVQQLANLAGERHKALGAAGFAASESGMEPWLAASGAPDVRAQWQQLLGLTAQAKELNRVNGMLINKQLAHTRAALGALQTPGEAPEAGVYGPGGQTIGGGPSKRFVVG